MEESSSPPEDSSRDPLILKIFNMMQSWDERITKLVKRDETQTDGKEKVPSPSRQSAAAVALVERVFSPQQSPRSSPFKGLKSVADERLAEKRGKLQGVSDSPRKFQRVSRETAVAKKRVISEDRSVTSVHESMSTLHASVAEKMGGEWGILFHLR